MRSGKKLCYSCRADVSFFDGKGIYMMKGRTHSLGRIWLLLVDSCAVIAALDIPARLVLGYRTLTDATAVDWILTVIFAADVVIRALESTKGRGGSDSQKQGTGYWGWWFVIDVTAAIPFAALPVTPILQLLRLLKLARVARHLWRWRQTKLQNPVFVRLVFFFFWLSLSVHWITCGWSALRGPTGKSDCITEYLHSLYWCVTTLTTVGYGDITPTTNAEILYAMAVMVLGVGVYGYIIGNVAGLLANLDPARVRHRELVDKVTAFMRYRKVPKDLQRRILDYYSYMWEKRLGYNESTAISELPPSLRTELYLFLNRDIIQKVSLFREAGDDFIRAVAHRMRPVIFMPGDYIVRAGEQGEEMYFISRGTVEVISPDGKEVWSTLTDGDFFGEIALLRREPRTASIRAVDYCDVYSLSRTAFESILARHPGVADRIRKMAGERYREKASTSGGEGEAE